MSCAQATSSCSPVMIAKRARALAAYPEACKSWRHQSHKRSGWLELALPCDCHLLIFRKDNWIGAAGVLLIRWASAVGTGLELRRRETSIGWSPTGCRSSEVGHQPGDVGRASRTGVRNSDSRRDVEGLCRGIDEETGGVVGQWLPPSHYAGGAIPWSLSRSPA